MKTRRGASSLDCSAFSSARAAATSGRSCSAACRVFFERDVVAFVEAPDRGRTGFQPLLGPEPCANLFERQVRLRCNQIEQPLAMRLERRAAVARAGQCCHTARRRPAFDPADRGRSAETKHPRRFPSALAVFDKRDRPHPEVLRVSLRHRQTSPLLPKQPNLICVPVGTPLPFRFTSTENRSSAYWRPNRPFIAEPTGEVMLPLSVEGANSLLRSIDIVDEKQLYGTFAATALPMFRRFWQWLRARKVEIAALGTRCIGWHSEHVNEAGVIHLWDTSQVVEFLMGFRKLLHSHIARETLVRSRVKVGEPQKVGDWDKITQKYEPLTDEAIASRVFDLVYSDFVVPWRTNQESRAYSMLLYGPPGTGKTTIASSIANALKFRLITITVSDFLGAGGAMVEARAKAIFQMLEAQSDCVILFDEIDSFLLDRDSEHYRQQDTLFKFLTPGMLTKINDLRKGERSIFIIATNYANRIDPAIKRVGRVDKQYLLLSPDQKKRAAIIKGLFPKGKAPAAGTIDQMARESVFLGYSEIEGAIKDKLRRPWSDAIEALRAAARSSSDKHYLARVQQETTFPEAEFVAAIKLVAETGKVSEVKKRIKVLSAKDKSWGDLIKRSPDMESQLRHLRVLD